MKTEKRISVRTPSGEPAKIILDNADPIGCIICDQSEEGLALKVNSVLGIPNTFMLFIPNAGRTLDAQIVWKKPGKIGVVVQRTSPDR